MSTLSRRDFNKLALGALSGTALVAPGALAAKRAASSLVAGVQIGVQSYSFRDRPLEKALEAIVDIGISSVELFQGHLDPLKTSDAELKSWREKFKGAGVKIGAYNVSPRNEWTDEQIDRGFEAARLLGTRIITSSVSKTVVPRLDKACQKHHMWLGLHNHWFHHSRPDQFEGPDDFLDALKSSSSWMSINLDVGHFYASGYDPVKFITEHHARIVSLHLKDRGDDANHTDHPFGQGSTPLAEVMRLLKKIRFKYAANIEWEVKNADPVQGVTEALAYLKKALTL